LAAALRDRLAATTPQRAGSATSTKIGPSAPTKSGPSAPTTKGAGTPTPKPAFAPAKRSASAASCTPKPSAADAKLPVSARAAFQQQQVALRKRAADDLPDVAPPAHKRVRCCCRLISDSRCLIAGADPSQVRSSAASPDGRCSVQTRSGCPCRL
jgi:hypothetical protein